jgi:hypothetical protein
MADKPYQKKVDEFLADYTDKFIPTLITGKGTPETPYTNMGGPETAIPMTKDQAQLERDKLLASSIHPDTFNKVLDTMKGGTFPSHQIALGTPMSQFSNSLEGQRVMRERAIPIPGVSTGFNPSGATLADIQAAIPPDFLRGGNVINMTPGPTGAYEAERPVPGGWDWRGELAKQGTWSAGPERFFIGDREVPAGTPGAVSGDQLARERIGRGGGSAIPLSALGESAIPMGRGGEVPTYEMPGEIRTALQGIQNILMRPTERPWSPRGYVGKEGGYSRARMGALENFAGSLEKLAATGAGYQTKMAEIGSEKPYREAVADYYRRMAGVHEAAIPSEAFARYATGMHALSESERPYAFAPNSAVYQGAKLLGYVPEKPEAIHPIIRDIINKSVLTDPNTGMAGGFDIKGARQKIGFMAPWLKSLNIDVPKESYKMTKPEFLAEQKAWTSRLTKKERAKYTPKYTDQLWTEYWGKD